MATWLTVDSSIEDLNRIVEHYGNGEPVSLVGHSWGGTLVTAYVGRYPEKVAHLVVAEPGGLTREAYADFRRSVQFIDLSLAFKAVRLWFESLHVSGPDAYARSDYFVGHLAEQWEFSPTNGFNCPGTPVPKDHFWRAGAAAYQAIPSSARDENGNADWSVMTEGLETYADPVLMLVSACNQWVGLEYQRRYHLDLYPSVEVVVIEDAGHDMFWENPRDSIAAVRDFLGRQAGTGGIFAKAYRGQRMARHFPEPVCAGFRNEVLRGRAYAEGVAKGDPSRFSDSLSSCPRRSSSPQAAGPRPRE